MKKIALVSAGVILSLLLVEIFLRITGFGQITPTLQFDLTDPDGRRWTGSLEAGKPSSWTLWEGEQPTLWWTRQDKGGILSHRQGVQFRWRTVVREPLESGFERLAVPENYAKAACYESDV